MPALDHLLTMSGTRRQFLDGPESLSCALPNDPRAISPQEALLIGRCAAALATDFDSLPFPAPRCNIAARLDPEGMLKTKVKYLLRGDNNCLRVTFHRTPKEKQQEIAQYLALSDGFRGKVTSVKTSDPYATDAPFEVEYELTQEKFVDWSKKPVRIPALLPLTRLPEPPKKSDADARSNSAASRRRIERDAPPASCNNRASAAGTSVRRDYATSLPYTQRKKI